MGPFVRPPAPNFNITASDLAEQGFLTVQRLQNALSAIVDNVALEDASFDNTVRQLAQAENELNFDAQYMSLLRSVAPLSKIRQAASDAGKEIIRGYLAMLQHERLFALVDAVHDRAHKEDLDYESNGFSTKSIPPFMANVGSEPGSVWKSEQALAGLSRGKLESLDQDSDGNRRINLTRPDVTAVLRQCHVDETRREVFLRSQAIFPDNVPIFQEAMVLRDKAARLLGHPSFSAQRLKDKMAKSPETVDKFLAELNGRLQPLICAEIRHLRRLKDAREDSSFYLWDFEYYHQKILKGRRVDHEVVSEYFPADHAIQQMNIFQHLFDLSIEEVKDRADDQVWHPDVKMFAEYMTYLGRRGMPCSAGIARSVRDFVETPSQLLEYWCWNPETLQQLSCHYSYLSDGHRQARCRLQGQADAKQPSKELPRELIAELIASKHVNQGISTSRLVALGMFDMQVHDPKSSGDLETTSIANTYSSLLRDVTHLAGPKDGASMGHGYATTAHFMWGAEANYYSYLHVLARRESLRQTCGRRASATTAWTRPQRFGIEN
ncbi:Neurolysin, putative [Tolypocladium paradoxum]|uniref:Neurolysin, putative n=1 Tax=Tolypocladium paradoxum TaxID=94208 RepID=A0A2S4L504_9HYPO|nr:Neurolysin, putative [Tolypocladium paradoxum]